jgi:glutathione S-transferase
MTIKFYYWPFSSATRVQWCLEELGVPYEKMRLNRDKKENWTADYLAISPMGMVPAMTDDGANLFESLALVFHLGDKYGAEKGLWPKSGTPERGEAYSWAVWGTVQLAHYYVEHMMHTVDLHFTLPKEKRNPEIAASSKKRYDELLGILDKRLAGRDYIMGKSFTLVDAANAAQIAGAAHMAKLSFDGHKNVAAWMARCTSRPAFTKVMSET